MKKLCFLLIFALLLSLGASAYAASGIEIAYMDGVAVVTEYYDPYTSYDDPGEGGSLLLPSALVDIGEEAFAGTAASVVGITENVKSIGPRAFAECPNLSMLLIPATVMSIDDTAVADSPMVTVYGETGSEAYRFAKANGIPFVATDAAPETPEQPLTAPVEMPYMAF